MNPKRNVEVDQIDQDQPISKRQKSEEAKTSDTAEQVIDKNEALGLASRKKKTDIVKALLEHKPNDIHISIALHKAILQEDIEIIEILLKSGADANAIDVDTEHTPLHNASSNPNVIKILLKHGANIEALDPKGNTPLHFAAQENLASVKVLLEQGANIHATNSQDLTPLHKAAMQHKTSIIEYLVLCGLNINSKAAKAKIFDNETPLECCITYCTDGKEKETIETISALLKLGSKLFKALHVAITYRKTLIVEFLIKIGADVNEVLDKAGYSPLHLVTAHTKTDLDNEIYDDDTDDENDENDDTDDGEKVNEKTLPFEIAKIDEIQNEFAHKPVEDSDNEDDTVEDDLKNSKKIFKMLLQKNADVNAINCYKETPLHLANDPKFVDELLNYGANINAQDKKGRTALYIAIQRENKEVFEVLLKRGADVHLKKYNGLSPLELALQIAPIWFFKMMLKYSNIEVTDEIN